MHLYPARALERAMKIKEVMARVIGGEISWIRAAEIIGMSDRSLRRWRKRWEKFGYDGLFDKRTKRPSPRRVPLVQAEKVLRLYREQYFDLNVKHFVEKLQEKHDIQLSYSWVKTALQAAGLVQRYRKRGAHRKRRARRPLPGMMLHVDGSKHRWIPGLDSHWDLIVVFDDATSRVYYAQLVEEESTATVMAALKQVVAEHGVFCSLYADRGSHLVHTQKRGTAPDPEHVTQIARALRQLGIELILANSPQARGRCERLFGTWQGRLPAELRLAGIGTVEAANRFMNDVWIGYHNRTFTVPATQEGTAFLPYTGSDLERIFSMQHLRQVGNDNTVRFQGLVLQIPQQTFRFSMARCQVIVARHLDQTLSVYFGPHHIGRYGPNGDCRSIEPPSRRDVQAQPERRSSPISDPDAKNFEIDGKERKKKQKRKKAAAA